MKITPALTASILATSVLGQTPTGFNVTTSSPLGVVVEPGIITITPGLLVDKSATLNTPLLSLQSTNLTNGTYVAFMIDRNVPLLHWFQPNLVPGPNRNLIVNVAVTGASTAIGAPYISPQPPAGSGAHQYVFVLYQQPASWTVPSNYSTINPPASTSNRIGFDIATFVRVAGLGQPVGANYFRVLNGTAEESSSAVFATTSGTAAPVTSASATAALTATTTGTGTRPSSVASATGSSTASATASVTASAAAAPGRMVHSLLGRASGLLIVVAGLPHLVI